MKKKIPQDTQYFTYNNPNPKDVHTGDCVIRALTLACNMKYEDVLRELIEIQLKTGYMIDDSHTWSKFLKNKGFVKLAMPKTTEGKKVRGTDFCRQLKYRKFYDGLNIDEDTVYVCKVGIHHIVCIKDYKFWDIWNSSGECMGQVWALTSSK